jgi:hypothetical protein
MIKFKKTNGGFLLVQVLVFATVAALILTALVGWAGINIQGARHSLYREQEFQIAEAGIEYYRWHLAHAPADYKDGTNSAGPYVHNYYDKDNNLIGQFSLDIVAPPTGSTKVVVRSKGTVTADPGSYRRIEVQFAKPSIAKYAAVSNAIIYYGGGDEVWGPIHSNQGVGFFSGNPQPKAHNTVTSAVSTFNDVNGKHFGVYTSVPNADPTPPAVVPSRPDVFMGGRQFPVPAVDFSGMTTDLNTLKTAAQASGFYRAGSGGSGYQVTLKTNGTFDLYKVTSLMAAPGTGASACSNTSGEANWGTWSVNAKTLLGNYAFPSNGILFFEDHVWVEGQINGARITVVAATFPVNAATYRNIIVNNNLLYTKFDGTDTIGLIAQGNFQIGLFSADNLTIDAAIVAQNGATYRQYYRPASGGRNYCSPNAVRTSLTTYGMFATNAQAYFLQNSASGQSGYLSQPASYDTNLLYSPPPTFPLLSDQYITLYWQEIK